MLSKEHNASVVDAYSPHCLRAACWPRVEQRCRRRCQLVPLATTNITKCVAQNFVTSLLTTHKSSGNITTAQTVQAISHPTVCALHASPWWNSAAAAAADWCRSPPSPSRSCSSCFSFPYWGWKSRVCRPPARSARTALPRQRGHACFVHMSGSRDCVTSSCQT